MQVVFLFLAFPLFRMHPSTLRFYFWHSPFSHWMICGGGVSIFGIPPLPHASLHIEILFLAFPLFPLDDLWRWSSSSGWALLGDAPTAGVDARAARGAWPPARREHAAAPCAISREGDDEFDDDDDALRAAQCFYIFGGVGAFSPLSRPPPHHLPHTTP